MTRTNRIWRRIPILAALALALAAAPTLAREGFYLGGGFASQSVTGDFNGDSFFSVPAISTNLAVGKLSSGTGFALLLGYGFTPLVGAEFLTAITNHNATFPVLPDSKATVSASLLGLRLNWAAMDNLELLARFGLAIGSTAFKDYAVNLSTGATEEVTYNGSGIGYGVGAEMFFDKVAVGVNYTTLNLSYDTARISEGSVTLDKKLKATIGQLTAIVSYYFK